MSIIDNSLLRHKQAKTNSKNRCFGVIMMPLSTEGNLWTKRRLWQIFMLILAPTLL